MWSKSLNGNEPIILEADEWDATNWAFPCESDVPEGGRTEPFLRFDAAGLTIDFQHGSVPGAHISDLLYVCYLFLVRINEKTPHVRYQRAAEFILGCLDQLRLKGL